MHVPGLKIAIPSNAYDAKGLMKTALLGHDPVLFIENVKLYGTSCEVPAEDYTIPFGKARTLREGKDVTVVALSGTVPEALAAAESAAKAGIEVEVVDPRTLNPLDDAGISASLRKTGRLIIVHDAYRTCGVAAEISQRMMETSFDYLNAPILRVTGLDVPVPSGALYQNVVPNRDTLLQAIESIVN
jgi:pyruvate dehydrogenase E1 component beta subunit